MSLRGQSCASCSLPFMFLNLSFEVIPFFPLQQSRALFLFWMCIYRESSPFFFFRVRVLRGACLACVFEQPNVPCNLRHMERWSTALAGPGGHCLVQPPGFVKTEDHIFFFLRFSSTESMIWWRPKVTGGVWPWITGLLSASENESSLSFILLRDPVSADDVTMSWIPYLAMRYLQMVWGLNKQKTVNVC